MGFFNRRARDPAVPAKHHKHEKHHHGEAHNMSMAPSFGQWLKAVWLDILTMFILGAIGLGVYFAPPAPSRSFAITFSDGEVVYPQFAYPLRKEIVPIWAAALLAALVPMFFFLVLQIRVRSFWDFNNACLGVLYSLITAAVFQVFIKWLIGGLRPHFLDVCKPDPALVRAAANGVGGFQNIYFTPDICTGDRKEINDSLESMPSGHATAAFAGFVYLYLYLNAKLKVFSNYHPSLWKMAVTYMPLLAACLIAGALSIDEFHHWYDLLAGAIIGTVMAFSAYRMTFAAIWDWRFNHIPLNRSAPFMYGVGESELHGATFTRKAGWGWDNGTGHGFGSGVTGRHGVTGVNGHHNNGVAGNGVRGDHIV